MDNFENRNDNTTENTDASGSSTSGEEMKEQPSNGENFASPQQPAETSESAKAPENENIFGEKSFAPQQPQQQGYIPNQPYGQNNMGQANYYNPYYNNNGNPPSDMQYRQLYQQSYGQPSYNGGANGYYRQNMPGGNGQYSNQVPPPSQYYPNNNYPSPEIPAVSPMGEAVEKKASRGWIIAIIIIVVLLLAGVMILLAVYNDENKDVPSDNVSVSSEAPTDSSGVSVNINVAPKPVEEDEYYRNRETGLLTPAGAVKQVLPSIVSVFGYTNTSVAYSSEASGIIISDDGYIITNAHAVENIIKFKVRLSDDREFEAQLIGLDSTSDLAVLKIEADDLVPAVIGNAADMVQGDEVVAIGNAGGFNNSVSVGCISHTEREINSYTGYKIKCFQTDAALNSGISGGALVNLYGQIIGITTSKNVNNDIENIGFAIRTDFAVPIIEDIISKGYVTGRPRVGVTYRFIDVNTAAAMGIRPGMLIDEIAPECDISNTDLQKDDIITYLDGVQLLTESCIKDFQQTHKAGDVVTAKVYRVTITGEETEFEITFRLEETK